MVGSGLCLNLSLTTNMGTVAHSFSPFYLPQPTIILQSHFLMQTLKFANYVVSGRLSGNAFQSFAKRNLGEFGIKWRYGVELCTQIVVEFFCIEAWATLNALQTVFIHKDMILNSGIACSMHKAASYFKKWNREIL